MQSRFNDGQWAVILGGSSGFGLATAFALAERGMNLCLVHRDRRSLLADIEVEFEKLRGIGVEVQTFNVNALSVGKRDRVLDELAATLGGTGRVRVLLHSIAFGNLRLLTPEAPVEHTAVAALAQKLGADESTLQAAFDELFAEGVAPVQALASPPGYSDKHFLDEEDFSRTIHAMGTSLLGWVQGIFARELFSDDARVFGLTSEGNEIAWKGYAAVAAAKVALESLARSIAVEYAPFGLRCNVIQAGITDTPALAAIPGSEQMKAQARMRNPFRRLTTPRDVANVIALLATDEAAWINGEVIRVDGGEHISGVGR